MQLFSASSTKKAKLAQLCHLCGTVVRYYLFDTLDAWTNVSMLWDGVKHKCQRTTLRLLTLEIVLHRSKNTQKSPCRTDRKCAICNVLVGRPRERSVSGRLAVQHSSIFLWHPLSAPRSRSAASRSGSAPAHCPFTAPLPLIPFSARSAQRSHAMMTGISYTNC